MNIVSQSTHQPTAQERLAAFKFDSAFIERFQEQTGNYFYKQYNITNGESK
mgnify:CR=1 FL=1